MHCDFVGMFNAELGLKAAKCTPYSLCGIHWKKKLKKISVFALEEVQIEKLFLKSQKETALQWSEVKGNRGDLYLLGNICSNQNFCLHYQPTDPYPSRDLALKN